MSTIVWQRVEGTLVFLAALVGVAAIQLFSSDVPDWLPVVLFFAPDLAFLAYVAGPRVGALVYNTLHLYGVGLIILVAGTLGLWADHVAMLGLLWMGHVGFDRMLGYGLKEPTGFSDTHLGRTSRS